jgi:hypothetical protein
MYLPDLYWMPSTAIVAYEWAWLCGHTETLRPVRVRVIFGLFALLLATGASLTLLATVVGSWIVGSFAGLPGLGGPGLFLGMFAVLVSIVAEGRVRLVSLIGGLLSFFAWYGYLWDRHNLRLGVPRL